MAPQWKFRDVAAQRNQPRPFYEQPWPADLPDHCQICGTKFRTAFNITHGSGKAGRILRAIAYWSILPCILIGGVLPLLIPAMYEGLRGYHGAWLFFGGMFLPPLLLGGFSVVMPKSRHLLCKKCGWERDYRTIPPPDFRKNP